jgi:hypothetical protein
METKDAGEEEMERNNTASQNSQRFVELKKKSFNNCNFSKHKLMRSLMKGVTVTSKHNGDVLM